MAITENPGTPVVKFGFGAAAYTGYLLTDIQSSAIGEQEDVRAAGVLQTVLTWNKGISYTINALIEDGGAVESVPKKGEAFSFTPPQDTEVVLYCMSSSVAMSDQSVRVSLVGEKRDDVTFVIPTPP